MMTTLKTLVLAAALMSLPGLSLAMGCSHSKQQAQSCADGATWDSATGTCIPVVNS
ncbi:hypothetical protein [Aliishimia ponticola]|uniref:hypothetical protein n=1 Tax=Aliishimia ponticola TaxID=2499833 RepID=UPI001B3B8963|nr:hypothetical protein [Aliishimia ponticola]